MVAAPEPTGAFSADREAASARARGVAMDRTVPAWSAAEASDRTRELLDSGRTRDLTDVVNRSAAAGVTEPTAAETAFGAASAS